MTELGELVAIGMVETQKIDCPFHEKKHQCDNSIKNDLAGDAAVLGNKLESKNKSDSTVLRNEPAVESYKSLFRYQPDPDNTLDYDTERHIPIHSDIDCEYPVAYAAHHIIPAGASLKKADKLLPYIEKSKGKICCNLGYDVNGNENGVWLPGLHAVNSNGINKWSGASPTLPDNEKWKKISAASIAKSSRRKYQQLVGPRPGVDAVKAYASLNMKWLYVEAAMHFPLVGTKRQFHDSHPSYSKSVKDSLNNIGEVLKRLSTGNAREKIEPSCGECKKNRQNKQKPQPPYGLLGLLNNTSQHVKSKYLVGRTYHAEYYTSSWCSSKPPLQKPRKKSK